MEISKIELLQQAATTKFQPDMLEKVWHLMDLLEAINHDSYLESRLALKGGTALNLFIFHLPRLSVDIDFNYIGSSNREIMMEERSRIEKILEAIILSKRLTIKRIQGGYAGSKWSLQYGSMINPTGTIEIDLNFMHRIPLWETQKCNSHAVGEHVVQNVRLMSLYDIIGGKISALMDRHAARDYFDTHQIFTTIDVDAEKFRLACILYGAMSSFDWRTIVIDKLAMNFDEIKRFLVPLLRKNELERTLWESKAESVLKECKDGFNKYLFPFTPNELEFFDVLYRKKTLQPSLLTDSHELIEKIQQLPTLKRKLEMLEK